MKYSEVLTKAKELLKDPKNWNKDGGYYRNANPNSGCYCIFGALGEVNEQYGPEWSGILHGEMTGVSSSLVVEFNDDPDTTHQDLMDWFDKTIREVKLREFVKYRLKEVRSQ